MGRLAKHTLAGVKWTLLESVSLKAIRFGIGIIVARILTPADYGLVGMIGIFMAVASVLADSGMSNALVRKKSVTEADMSTVFVFNIVMSAACYAILWYAAPFIAAFFREPVLVDIVRVISINLIVGALGSVHSVRMTIKLDFKSQAKISAISALVSGLISIMSAYYGMGVWALVVQSVSATTISTLLYWILSHWRPLWLFSSVSFGSLFGYSSKLLASSMLHTIYMHVTTLLIGRFYSPKSLGYYSRGEQYPALIEGTIMDSIGRVTFPILSRLQDDDTLLINAYRQYIKSTSLVISFMLLSMAAISHPLVSLLLTDKWLPAVPFVQLFCIAYLLDNVCVINLHLLQVKGRSDLVLKLEIIKKSISLAMLFAAVPFGVMAICAARVAYAQIAVFINTYYTGKLFGLGYMAQVKDFGPYIFYAALSALPALMLTFTGIGDLACCIIGMVSAALIYFCLLSFTKDTMFDRCMAEARAMLKDRL